MRRLAILVLLLALVGCSYSLWLKIEGDLASPRVTIAAPRIMQPTTCLDRFWVAKASHPQDRLWEAKAVNGACAPQSQIIYGRAPAGFEELAAARALESGVLYEAHAVSRGVSGVLSFVYLDGGWNTVTRQSELAAAR
ncbi:hypothetical protein [Brevundimonas sp. SORGH_AS_0993]|uniref:hypothetical protein n=1 Tax=Brevundimonas sp. SORGH_AS_0993 TaxID=3041794 RepID=UPI00278A2BE2|nr:hypothetical protein [Brevundimonas sp. SORGH_AS_0993]MDQ1152921.1 hypothetical protein [Brevundimonas sp. SORGH_AS_0993]